MYDLVVAGDSWTYGSEIINTNLESNSVRDWDEVNDEYRNSNIYSHYLSNYLNANLKNLSFPAYSNDRILRVLINYITKFYLFPKKNTKDLFVIVGLTSPERKDFYYNSKNTSQWMTMWPAWEHNYSEYDGVNDFMKSYITYFSNKQEYLNRYVNQVYYLENFFKNNKIKYLLFQSFYQPYIFNNKISEWQDSPYVELWDSSFHGCNDDDTTKYFQGSSEREIWSLVDNYKFMNKNEENHSFHSYLLNHQNLSDENCFVGLHPNEKGHEIWANHIFEYIKKHNLLSFN